MPIISNDGELRDAKALVDEHIQEIQNYLGDSNNADGKIRFPRGYLRPVGHFLPQLSFIDSATLKRNLAYALILSDVLRWVTNRTDLWGLPKEMVSKMGIVVMGSICEAMAVNGTRGVIGRRHSFCERANRMVAEGIITTALKDDLHWLWGKRSGVHLHDLTHREYGTYEVADYNRAVRTTQELRASLQVYHA